MTTDPFITATHAEADRRMRADGLVTQAAIVRAQGFAEGAEWARTHLAAQDSAALSVLRAAVDGPHPANSVLDAYTLAYVSARLDEFVAARAVGRDAR